MINLSLSEMGDYRAVYPNGDERLISVAEANRLFEEGKAQFTDEA